MLNAKSGQWLTTPLASLVQRQENAWLGPRLASLPGESLLWIDGMQGAPVNFERVHRIRTLVRPDLVDAGPDWASHFSHQLLASVEALPFASSSYQALVIRHGFEFATNLHIAVNEAARVLELGGQMLIVAFNPLSSWGLRSLMLRRLSGRPFSGRFVMRSRLADLLRVLGFRLLDERFAVYRPPLQWLGRLGSANSEFRSSSRGVGVGALYFMQARKEGFGMSLIRPVRRTVVTRRLVPAIVKRLDETQDF